MGNVDRDSREADVGNNLPRCDKHKGIAADDPRFPSIKDCVDCIARISAR